MRILLQLTILMKYAFLLFLKNQWNLKISAATYRWRFMGYRYIWASMRENLSSGFNGKVARAQTGLLN